MADFPYTPEELAKRGITGEISPQNERIGKYSNQMLDFYTGAPGNWCAHDKVFLSSVAHQQSLEGGQQGHEQGHTLAGTQRPQRLDQGQGQLKSISIPSRGLHRRAGVIGRQFQQGGRT